MKKETFIKSRLLPLLLSALIVSAVSFGFGLTVSAAGNTVLEFYNSGEKTSSTEYSSFGDAWNAAVASATTTNEAVITVGGDYVLGSMLEMKANQHITIDLNGYCLRRDLDGEQESDGGLFILNSKSVLTIKDSRPKSAGYDDVKGGVLADGASTDTGGCFQIKASGEVKMEGGTVYNCTTDLDGGCAHIENGKFTMTGGRIYGCKTIDSADNCHGGAIYVADTGIYSAVKLSDCKIDNCYSEDKGGGIFTESGSLICNNVIFSGNHCRDHGGAICLWNNTEFTAHNCTFVNNYAEDDGGAVYVNDAAGNHIPTLFMDCIFRNNEAGVDGGAIYVCDDGVALAGVEMTNNYAKNRGGAIFVDARYDIAVKGLVTIKDNSAGDAKPSNLTLEFGTTRDALVKSAGLYRGSYIGIGTTKESDKDVAVTYHRTSRYQTQYFHPDSGTLKYEQSKYSHPYVQLVTSSIFGEGSTLMIVILGTIGVMLMAAVIIYKKKKDKKLLAAEAADVSESIEIETVDSEPLENETLETETIETQTDDSVINEEGGAEDDQNN